MFYFYIFLFQGKFFLQISGNPVDSALSPIIADIFMEACETVTFDFLTFKPKVLFRFTKTIKALIDHINE